MAGRLLTLRRQLETRRRFQTFVGCVPILMSAGNGPSTPDVPWARTDSQTRWKRTVNSRRSLGRVLTHMAARNAPSNIRWERNKLSLPAVNVPSIPNVRWARTLNFRKVRLLRTDSQTSAGNVPTISYVQSTTYLTTLTVTPATQRRTFG